METLDLDLEVVTSWVFDKESASQTIGYGFDNILTQQPRNVGTVSYLGQDVKESCDEYMT